MVHFLEYDLRRQILLSVSDTHSNSLRLIIVAKINLMALGRWVSLLLSPLVVVSRWTHTLLLEFFTFVR